MTGNMTAPPGSGERRRPIRLLGAAEIFAGAVCMAMAAGLALLQRSVQDPHWVVTTSISLGILPPALVICLGISIIPARRRAAVLLSWWIALLLAAFAEVVAAVIGLLGTVAGTAASPGARILYVAMILLPLVSAALGSLAYVAGRAAVRTARW